MQDRVAKAGALAAAKAAAGGGGGCNSRSRNPSQCYYALNPKP